MTLPSLRRSPLIGIIGFLLLFFCTPAIGLAQEEHPLGISLAFRHAVLTGEEESGFNWSDLWDDGNGGSLEISYRINPPVAILGGISYDSFPGKDISLCCPLITGKFSNLSPYTFYVGGKFFLLQMAAPTKTGADPYFRLDFGLTRFNSYDFEGFSIGNATTVFSWDIGLGVDVAITPVVGFFVEAKYQDYGKPDQAGNTLTAFPISVGFRISP